MATVSVESFFILEICCNNKILFKQDCFDQLEKFQEQKGKSQRVTIAQESFFMFETCPYHKGNFVEITLFLTFPACFSIQIIFSNLNYNCSNLLDLKTSRNRLKSILLPKIVLTFHCLNKLFQSNFFSQQVRTILVTKYHFDLFENFKDFKKLFLKWPIPFANSAKKWSIQLLFEKL